MKAKITSFRTCNTSSSLPHLFQMLFLFPQRSQVRMFVNVAFRLAVDSIFILMEP